MKIDSGGQMNMQFQAGGGGQVVELPDGKKHRSAIWNALGVYRGIRHGQKEENKMELEQGLKQFSSVGGRGLNSIPDQILEELKEEGISKF
jgi:hypothetical protein